jgi:hypothetical protein
MFLTSEEPSGASGRKGMCTYLFLVVRQSDKADCAERVLSGTVISSKRVRLVSSEGNEKYVTSDVTDAFEIGFLDGKKVIYGKLF